MSNFLRPCMYPGSVSPPSHPQHAAAPSLDPSFPHSKKGSSLVEANPSALALSTTPQVALVQLLNCPPAFEPSSESWPFCPIRVPTPPHYFPLQSVPQWPPPGSDLAWHLTLWGLWRGEPQTDSGAHPALHSLPPKGTLKTGPQHFHS